ncbi:MAG: LysM and BON domain-containing protein [Pseudomonadota bacterium]|nr:LysM and BON domain-containing protein [Pseudomonadota bacterium]
MGMLDFIKNAGAKILGRDRDDSPESTKPLSTHLREHGIDPSGIDFKFNGDTVVMEGVVPDQETREKAVLIVGNVDGIARVDDRLRVGAASATTSPGPGASSPAAAGVAHSSPGSAGGAWNSRTYTVESGDTLSGIAKQLYGDASKYPAIFEANKPMLKDPDEIYPGQVLRIPPQG